MKTFLIILAIAFFTTVGLCAAAMCLVLRLPMAAFVIMLLVITVDIVAAVLLESDAPKPPPQSLKRVRSLFRATGPAQTRICDTLTIVDPHPDTHGEVTRAVYPRGAN
jgi:hypothetical protein